jgi:pSer/pThr/pTyr-binding forkhead associated (FHA) protein
MIAKLIGRTGVTAGQDFVIDEHAHVGASSENEVRIIAPGVSRRHARIWRENDQFWLEDVGATNGTFLNGGRVQREVLRHLDVITLGRAVDLIFLERDKPSVAGIERALLVKIQLTDGEGAGTFIDVPKGELSFGRSDSCSVVLDSRAIGKLHARLQRTGNQVLLQDLQSANGTFVNGKRIDIAVLKNGDVLNFAGVRGATISMDGEAAAAADAAGANPAAAAMTAFDQEWKTRFMWAPDDMAAIESARKDAEDLAQLRAPAPDPKAGTKPAVVRSARAKPAAKATPRPAAPAPSKPAAHVDVKPPPSGPVSLKESVFAPPEGSTVDRGAAPASPKPAAASKSAPPSAKPEAPVQSPPAPVQPPPAAPPAASPTMSTAPSAPAASAPPVEPEPPRIAGGPLNNAIPAVPASSAVDREVLAAPGPAQPPSPAAPDMEPASPMGEVTRTSITMPRGIARPASRPRSIQLVSPGKKVQLGCGTFTVGRATDADVRVDDRRVSRAHARITVDETTITVEDLQTVNGTIVNGRKIEAPEQLHDGDTIVFGSTHFKVEGAVS